MVGRQCLDTDCSMEDSKLNDAGTERANYYKLDQNYSKLEQDYNNYITQTVYYTQDERAW